MCLPCSRELRPEELNPGYTEGALGHVVEITLSCFMLGLNLTLVYVNLKYIINMLQFAT